MVAAAELTDSTGASAVRMVNEIYGDGAGAIDSSYVTPNLDDINDGYDAKLIIPWVPGYRDCPATRSALRGYEALLQHKVIA